MEEPQGVAEMDEPQGVTEIEEPQGVAEMDEPQGVTEIEDSTELHQLQQQLHQAKETIAQLQAQQRKDFHKRQLLVSLVFLLVSLLLATQLPVTKFLFDEETKVSSGPLSGPVATDSHPDSGKFD